MFSRKAMTGFLIAVVAFACGVWLGFAAPKSKIYLHFFAWRQSLVLESKQSGEKIVSSLKRYFNEKGEYPIQLSDLTTKYIKHLDPPTAGDQTWRYKTNREGTWFSLSFALDDSDYPICIFYSDGADWNDDA